MRRIKSKFNISFTPEFFIVTFLFLISAFFLSFMFMSFDETSAFGVTFAYSHAPMSSIVVAFAVFLLTVALAENFALVHKKKLLKFSVLIFGLLPFAAFFISKINPLSLGGATLEVFKVIERRTDKAFLGQDLGGRHFSVYILPEGVVYSPINEGEYFLVYGKKQSGKVFSEAAKKIDRDLKIRFSVTNL